MLQLARLPDVVAASRRASCPEPHRRVRLRVGGRLQPLLRGVPHPAGAGRLPAVIVAASGRAGPRSSPSCSTCLVSMSRSECDCRAGPRASYFPIRATIVDGPSSVGGVDLIGLAESYGTPLFVYDEEHLRSRCREAVAAFGDGVAYATKAFLSRAMARLAWEEGMYLDVATGGELHVALAAGVPADRLVMHGNNKSVEELAMALQVGVGRIVIDSFDEIKRIEELVAQGYPVPNVLVRVNPGVDAHTHEYLQTGIADSKFGFGISSGDAEPSPRFGRRFVCDGRFLASMPTSGARCLLPIRFARPLRRLPHFSTPIELAEISVGGGLGVAYVSGEVAPTITEWADSVKAACAENGITARITAEPGGQLLPAPQ